MILFCNLLYVGRWVGMYVCLYVYMYTRLYNIDEQKFGGCIG